MLSARLWHVQMVAHATRGDTARCRGCKPHRGERPGANRRLTLTRLQSLSASLANLISTIRALAAMLAPIEPARAANACIVAHWKRSPTNSGKRVASRNGPVASLASPLADASGCRGLRGWWRDRAEARHCAAAMAAAVSGLGGCVALSCPAISRKAKP